MSKLTTFNKYDVCPHQKLPNIVKTTFYQDEPVRITDVRHLKKLGERETLCRDCNLRHCACLWSKVVHIKNDERRFTRWRPNPLKPSTFGSLRFWQIRSLILEKFREGVRRCRSNMSLKGKDSTLFMMKPKNFSAKSSDMLIIPTKMPNNTPKTITKEEIESKDLDMERKPKKNRKRKLTKMNAKNNSKMEIRAEAGEITIDNKTIDNESINTAINLETITDKSQQLKQNHTKSCKNTVQTKKAFNNFVIAGKGTSRGCKNVIRKRKISQQNKIDNKNSEEINLSVKLLETMEKTPCFIFDFSPTTDLNVQQIRANIEIECIKPLPPPEPIPKDTPIRILKTGDEVLHISLTPQNSSSSMETLKIQQSKNSYKKKIIYSADDEDDDDQLINPHKNTKYYTDKESPIDKTTDMSGHITSTTAILKKKHSKERKRIHQDIVEQLRDKLIWEEQKKYHKNWPTEQEIYYSISKTIEPFDDNGKEYIFYKNIDRNSATSLSHSIHRTKGLYHLPQYSRINLVANPNKNDNRIVGGKNLQISPKVSKCSSVSSGGILGSIVCGLNLTNIDVPKKPIQKGVAGAYGLLTNSNAMGIKAGVGHLKMYGRLQKYRHRCKQMREQAQQERDYVLTKEIEALDRIKKDKEFAEQQKIEKERRKAEQKTKYTYTENNMLVQSQIKITKLKNDGADNASIGAQTFIMNNDNATQILSTQSEDTFIVASKSANKLNKSAITKRFKSLSTRKSTTKSAPLTKSNMKRDTQNSKSTLNSNLPQKKIIKPIVLIEKKLPSQIKQKSTKNATTNKSTGGYGVKNQRSTTPRTISKSSTKIVMKNKSTITQPLKFQDEELQTEFMPIMEQESLNKNDNTKVDVGTQVYCNENSISSHVEHDSHARLHNKSKKFKKYQSKYTHKKRSKTKQSKSKSSHLSIKVSENANLKEKIEKEKHNAAVANNRKSRSIERKQFKKLVHEQKEEAQQIQAHDDSQDKQTTKIAFEMAAITTNADTRPRTPSMHKQRTLFENVDQRLRSGSIESRAQTLALYKLRSVEKIDKPNRNRRRFMRERNTLKSLREKQIVKKTENSIEKNDDAQKYASKVIIQTENSIEVQDNRELEAENQTKKVIETEQLTIENENNPLQEFIQTDTQQTLKQEKYIKYTSTSEIDNNKEQKIKLMKRRKSHSRGVIETEKTEILNKELKIYNQQQKNNKEHTTSQQQDQTPTIRKRVPSEVASLQATAERRTKSLHIEPIIQPHTIKQYLQLTIPRTLTSTNKTDQQAGTSQDLTNTQLLYANSEKKNPLTDESSLNQCNNLQNSNESNYENVRIHNKEYKSRYKQLQEAAALRKLKNHAARSSSPNFTTKALLATTPASQSAMIFSTNSHHYDPISKYFQYYDKCASLRNYIEPKSESNYQRYDTDFCRISFHQPITLQSNLFKRPINGDLGYTSRSTYY